MNNHKKIWFLIGLCFVFMINACAQKPPRKIGVDADRDSSARFETILEAPSKEGGKGESGDSSGEQNNKPSDLPKIELDVPLANNSFPPMGGPEFPPPATDDDVLRDPYFNVGPPVTPYSRCGDGIRQVFEQCDLGNGGFNPLNNKQYNHMNVGNKNGCNIVCGLPFCGNGVTEKGEACDDGNNENGDGCSARCEFERCGNFILDPGEQCDDGNIMNGDGCSSCCLYEFCPKDPDDPFSGCTQNIFTKANGQAVSEKLHDQK